MPRSGRLFDVLVSGSRLTINDTIQISTYKKGYVVTGVSVLVEDGQIVLMPLPNEVPVEGDRENQ